MGRHSATLHLEYSRIQKAHQKRAFFSQFVRGASPLVLGVVMGSAGGEHVHAQALNLDVSTNNIIADGRTRTTITTNNNHTRISTETRSGDVGFNTFSDFQQAAGTRVDLMVPDGAGSLVNIVKNGVVINGELNAFKDGSIGGNVFFSSSNGFIVGKSGTVNVGSLTVNTPTQDFLDRVVRADGTVNNAVATQLMRGEIPMSRNGHVSIQGQVNAEGSITLQGQTIRVDGNTGPLTGDDIGQRTKFESTVNTTGMVEGAALVSRGGRISLVAAGASHIGGTLDVSTSDAAARGGEISVTGGDITVEATGELRADGGEGGDIVVFADDTLVVQDNASFSAAGFGLGDGGFIELSGRNAHIGSVNVDLSSQFGSAGSLLIDPYDLFIGGASTASGASDDYSVTTSILSYGANILLQADNSITVVSGGVIDSRSIAAGVSTGDSGDITVEAPSITLEDGSKVLAGVTSGSGFSAGDVLFNAARTQGGTAEIVIGQGGGTAPEVTGDDITFNATSTVDQASLLLALPSATAQITANGGSINAAGTFSANATATANGGVDLLPLGIVVTNVLSSVDIKGSTDINAANMALNASSSAISSVLTQSLAPADSSVDGAVAISTINSTAIARVGGAAQVDVTGASTIEASNTVASTVDATPQAATFGASVGVSVVDATTTAEIADAARVDTGTLALDAQTDLSVAVTAAAAAGGATEPQDGSKAKEYLDDPAYGGQATTPDGGVSVVGGLAISDLTSTTNARVTTSQTTTVTGALDVLTGSENGAEVIADGSAVDSATGVGVALGINIANVVNDALIDGIVNAASANLQAVSNGNGNVFITRATSGAGASNVGVAGSFTLNLLDTQSVARVSGGSDVTISGGGAVSLETDNQTDATAEALPVGGGATGDTVGVGASVALNILANRSVAEIADGGTVTGAGDLDLSARGAHAATTKASAGSAGGISVTPALGLSMINNTTTARLGTGGTQVVSGAVTVSALQHSTITTEATGEAAGSKAAIGAALALALVDDRASATTARNVNAGGAVSFTAAGVSSSTLKAIASAAGAKDAKDEDAAPTSTGDSVDKQATGEFTSASGKQQASGVGDSSQQSSTSTAASNESGRSAKTSEGKVSVAAAVAINVQNTQVTALVPDGVDISAGGAITVASGATTSGAATSDGQAVKGEDGGTSQVGIGVAVSVNAVNEANTAYLGDGTHTGAGVNVRALQEATAPTDTFLTSATSGAGGSKVGIAGSVALNLLTLDTTAEISGAATIDATTGASEIKAENDVSATATAAPSDEGVTGGKVGVGASFAFNHVTTTTTARLSDGATLTNGTGLAVEASSGLTTVTEASAGAAGGIAVDASVALALLDQTTVARIGTGNALTMGAGAISVLAANTGSNTATSTGENKSGKVGVGASAAVILGNGASGGALLNTSLTSATLARSVTAGSLSITATADRTYDANATATAGGGNFSDSDEKKNDKTGGTSTTADSLDKTKGSQRDQDGKKTGSKVTIAAAAGIAGAQDVVTARMESVTVDVAGAIDIGAENTVGMTASGIGAATNPSSKVGIGVGVGLAILNNTTSATIADNATITNASAISLSATSRENAAEPYRSKLTALGIAGASGKQVSVAGSIGVAISTGTTEATMGDNVTVTNGGAMSLSADNASHLSAKALAGSVSTNGIAIGGSIAVVVSEKEYDAGIGANSDLTGSALSVTTINRRIDAGPDFSFGSLDDLDAFSDSLADLATGKLLGNSNYYVEAIGGAGGSGVAVQGSFGVMVFSDTMTSAVGNGTTIDVGSGDFTLSSDADFVAKALSGALSASTSSAAVGVSSTVIVSSGETISRLGENAEVTSAGSFTNAASATQDIRTYAASASAASSAGVSGVAGVITSENRVEALMERGSQVTVTGSGAVALSAENDFDVFALAAGVGMGGTAGVGAAATVVTVTNTTRAALGDGTSAADRSEINASGAISITATATEDGDLFSVAGAAGGTAGVGAGAGIYVLGTTTEALAGDYAKLGNGFDSGSLTMSASDASRLLSVSGAAGVGGTAGAGAGVAVGVITKTTTAAIGANAVVETGNVIVDADSEEYILATTAGVGVGGKAGLAGAVTVASVNPTTTARIGDAAHVHANGNVAVMADSKTEIDMIDGAFAAGTAGIGASVGVTVINANTLATVGANAKVTALGNGAGQSYITGYSPTFTAYGSDEGFAPADYQADATDELTDANAASARSAGFAMLGQKRGSTPTTSTARGVIVNAVDKTSVRALSVAGAAGAVGISVSAGVPVITTKTQAQIGAGAEINRILSGGGGAATQDVRVAAASDIYTLGFSGAVAGGSVAGGAGVSVMVIDATTEATVASGEMTAEGHVSVSAKATQDIVGIGAAGAAAASAALAGGVSVIDITSTTKAELAGTVTAQGNVDVIADDQTRTAVLAGALAVGYVGVGAAVSVVNLDKEINAAIASGADVTGYGRRTDHAVYTGNSFGDIRSASRGVNVLANSAQSGFTLGVAGSAGGVGVAGVMALYLMDVNNTASIGNNASINTAGGNATGNAAQDVVVTARDETITSVAAGGVAVGVLGGLAGVVDVGVFKNTTAASIGDNVTLNAKRDVLVSGLSNKAGEAYVIGAGGGIVGLAAGIAIYNYGDGVAPGGEADKNISESSDDGSLNFASITGGVQDQASNGEVNDMLAQSDDARIVDVSQQAQARREAVDIASAASSLGIPAGTSASIGSGTLSAGGTVSVKSPEKLNVDIVTGAVAAGGLAGGAGIGVLNVDTGSTAQIDGTGTIEAGAVNVHADTHHVLNSTNFAGTAGLAAALSADVGIISDTSRTTATIKRKAITTSGAVAVNATGSRSATVDAIGVSVAGTLAVGASVAKVTIGGAIDASMSTGASVGTAGNRAASVSVNATADDFAKTESVAVGGGVGAAIQGSGSYSTIRPTVTASVDSAQIFTSGLTMVNAGATGSAETSSTGVAVAGGLAVGASDAETEISATVASNVTNSVINAGSIMIGTNALSTRLKSFSSGSAGALVGVNATVSRSENFTTTRTSVSNSNLTSTGLTAVNATNTTDQEADSSGLAVGIVAAGFNIARANSTTETTVDMTNLTGLSAGSLSVAATGTDSNNAVTVAGSGGVIAGSAATATTRTHSTTRAAMDTTGAAAYGVNVAGDATIAATHTSNFAGSVDSTQASLVGSSGASLGHDVNASVDAMIGNSVQFTAHNLALKAHNITLNPFLSGGATNVDSISGGLANVPAGGATVDITHNTRATIGADAMVNLVRPNAGPSSFEQEAYNNIVSNQKVKLDSGGAIATANAEIDATVIANATVAVGDDAQVTVDYGDIRMAAWGQGQFDMRSTATTYGLAGAPSGDANITYTGVNSVAVGTDALVQATDGDNPTNGDLPRYATVTIGSGTGLNGEIPLLKFNAIVDIFNKTAIPIPSAPNPTVTVANSGLVTMGTTSSTNMALLPQGIRAAGDIRISASRGTIEASAVGTGKDIYREALAKAASAVSNAFGGGDVTFDYHGGSTSTGGGSARLDINGRVETSIQRHKLLTIDETCEPTAISCIGDEATGNIEFSVSGPNPVGTEILARVAELAQLIEDYDTDPIAKAAYQNEINFLHKKLVGMGLGSFNAAGEFVPGTYAGPSPKAALEQQASQISGDISTVKVQLDSVAPTNIVPSLTELTGGVQQLYSDGTFGVVKSVNDTISVIQTMSTYDAGTHGATVTTLQNLRSQGLNAANAAKTAEASTIALRDQNIAKAAEIEAAQAALADALLANNASEASTQQGIISSAQSTIAANLTSIASNTSTISTQAAVAKARASSLETGLTNLLNSIPANPVTGTQAEKDAAIAANAADTLKRDQLLAPGTTDSNGIVTGAGSLTRVGLSEAALTDTVNSLSPVLTSINSAVSTLNANTGSTPGTVSGTKSLTQFIDLLGTLTTDFAVTTQNAAAASSSSGTPMAYTIEVDDTVARLGNIFISGDQLRTSGQGQLLAPGDAKIQITNNTHHTLKLGNLIVPTYDAGNLRFNGVLVHGPNDISELNPGGVASGFNSSNVVTSRTSSRGLVEIVSTYTPEAFPVADREIAPDIILKRGSVIENTNGAVRITSEAGNVYIRGTINAGSVDILAKDGDFVASYVNGFNHIGGDPASFTNHTSTTEQGPGITANGAISISARYLNINSTIQSGIAEWNLTLDGTPTLTASASAIGVSQADLDAANLANAATVKNSANQDITINRTPKGIDPEELAVVVDQYKQEVLEDPDANPVRTISVFGVATQVNIKDYLSEQITYSLEFTKAQAEAFAAATPTSDGVFSVVQASQSDNIGASYDAKNGQYVVNGASVKGGYIQLFGQIMNTASSTAVGKLNVLDGFGTININNASDIPVVLRNLSTGEDPTGTLRGIEGLIEITDIVGLTTTGAYSPSNPLIQVRKTSYTRDYVPGDASGTVRVQTQTGHINNADGNLILGGVAHSTGSDRGATYTPGPNQRYVWTTGEEFKRTSKYSQVSTQLFGSESLTVASITSLTLSGSPQLLNTYRLSDGTYVTTDKTLTGGGLTVINGGAFQDPAATESINSSLSGTQLTEANQSNFTKNDFVKTGESSRRCNWWTLCIASEKTYYYELRQEYTTIITESLKADYPIGVNFIGSNTGAINITSTDADVSLTSNLSAVAGTVSINAGTTPGSGASIIQGALAGEIKATTISLSADGHVGGITDPRNVAAPVDASLSVNLAGADSGLGSLSASAANGNVSIISREDLIVDQVTALGDVTNGLGKVDLFSFGSIDGKDQTARVQAPRVTLTALGGSVGGTAANTQLRVNTGYTVDPALREFGDPELDPTLRTNPLFGLTVTASGDIGVRSDSWSGNADGTMLVGRVQSSGGDVLLASTGQILDNNPVQSIDQRTYDQLLGYWEELGLLAPDAARGVDGSVNVSKQENAIKAFEDSTTQTYNQYWRIRGDTAYDPSETVTVDPGSAQYSALQAQFQAEAADAGVAQADVAAYVTTRISDYETQQTQEYHNLHAVVGDLTTTYQDGYHYTASAEERSELTRGSVWTERELAFSIAPGALKTVTGTNPVIKEPNVSGRSVTINADRGVGETIGAGTPDLGVSIRSSLDPRDLTLDQKVALAAAERNDLQLTVGPVSDPNTAPRNLPDDATPQQVAEYDAARQEAYDNAIALGLGANGVLTTLLLGAEESTLTNVQQAALDAAALGLVAPEHTLLTVLSKRPLNFNAVTDINVTVPNVSSGSNADIGSAFLASRGGAKLGNIDTFGDTRIKVFGDIVNAPGSVVQTGNLILEAAQGGIGASGAPLNLTPRSGATTTARAQNGVNIAFAGTGLIDTVFSPQDVKLVAQDSLLNANNDELINILGTQVTLDAVTGSIGTVSRALNTGVSAGGRIIASANNEINLFGPTATLFIIGSADAGGTIRLAASGESVIDGRVETAGTINLSAGARQVITGQGDVHSVAGLVDINSGSLKMLNGAILRADAGKVIIATDTDALVTGITSGSGDADAVSIDAGGAIYAGTLDPRVDITAMTPGAGVVLTAGLGIGEMTQANDTAADNTVTPVANPLRIRTNTLAATATDGAIELAALSDMILSDLQSPNGAITVVGDGLLTITSALSGGSQSFTAQDDLTFVELRTTGIPAVPGPADAGDITLVSLDGQVLGGTINAAGSSDITGNGVLFDTIIAGLNSTIISTGDIIGNLEEAGETIVNIAGFGDGNTGNLDVKVLRARNMELQATDELTLGTVEVGENLALRADIIHALDITQVPDGPDPLNFTLTGPDGTVATFAEVNVDAPAGIVMPQLFVSETHMTTTAQFVDIKEAFVPIQGTSPLAGTLDLQTPSQTVLVDQRSITPHGNPPSNTQIFPNGDPLALKLDGTTTATDSFVVVFDATVQVTDIFGVPFPGISQVRDTVRQIREADDPIILPGAFGSTLLDEDEDEDPDMSQFNGSIVQIDGVDYSVYVSGAGPAVLLRQ